MVGVVECGLLNVLQRSWSIGRLQLDVFCCAYCSNAHLGARCMGSVEWRCGSVDRSDVQELLYSIVNREIMDNQMYSGSRTPILGFGAATFARCVP